MATKSQIQKWMKKVETQMKQVADQRDKLDDTISEITSLKEDCYEAWERLNEARDALSRLV